MSEPSRQPDTGAGTKSVSVPKRRLFQKQPIMSRVIYALIPVALAATYFFGLAVLAVLAVLAAVLMLVERRLVKFGTCVLDVNNAGRRIEVPKGGTVLETLKSDGIFLPSACGGRGLCTYCKLKIVEGGGPVTPTEAARLSEAERAAGVRLACQVKVRNDMKLLVPERLLSARKYRGVIERITDLTYDIKALDIRLIEPGRISFRPGQYVHIEAPAHGPNPESVYRAFSMSSMPDRDDHIELIIRLVPGGICTTWVFTKLKQGQEVRFDGPHGDFHLSDSDREMVWIAGGSGMAPFWSMVRHMQAHPEIARKTTYFFGAVRGRDLFYLDELRKLDEQCQWFTFMPALSAAAPEDRWQGETGLITDVVDRNVPEASPAEVYLCGSPGMVDAARKVVKQKGIPPERIFFDKFG